MTIVSSVYVVGQAQADGRSYVQETHTTDLSEVVRVEYGPVGVIDYQATANARAVQLADGLRQQELEAILGDPA